MIVSDSTVLKANFPLLSRKPRKPVPRSWPMVRSVAADGQRRLAAPSPRSPPFPDVAEDARRRHKAASGGVPRIWRTTTPRRCLLFYSKQSKKKNTKKSSSTSHTEAKTQATTLNYTTSKLLLVPTGRICS